jgi:hypothetical protein
MTRGNLLVSAAVALICAGILAVFTDAELAMVRWFNCGPWASETARQESRCR